MQNQFIKFIKKPEGTPDKTCFSLEQESLREINQGDFLIKNLWLSMDPALVGRMRGESNYAESVNIGDTMHAYAVGQVIESNNEQVEVGELRIGRFDMQLYSIQKSAADSTRINTGIADPKAYLSVVGVTGATAYFGLFDIGQPKPGDTVLISAGASSVGTTVAQLAKNIGCKTVAIVSSEQKAHEVINKWGYDDAIAYKGKSITELEQAIKQACPNGVDIYFDNTSGDISEAVLDNYNDFARVVVCGRIAISHLQDTRNDTGRRDNSILLAKRIKKQGFVILDYQNRMPEAVLYLASQITRGKLKWSEDILYGIENTPAAFFRMLNGENTGKQLVELATPEHVPTNLVDKVARRITSPNFPTQFVVNTIKKRNIKKSKMAQH